MWKSTTDLRERGRWCLIIKATTSFWMPLAGPEYTCHCGSAFRQLSFHHHHSPLQSGGALTTEMKLQQVQDEPSLHDCHQLAGKMTLWRDRCTSQGFGSVWWSKWWMDMFRMKWLCLGVFIIVYTEHLGPRHYWKISFWLVRRGWSDLEEVWITKIRFIFKCTRSNTKLFLW